MNQVIIHGTVHDSQLSHYLGTTEYKSAVVSCVCSDGKMRDLPLLFKSNCCGEIEDGEELLFEGNLRSYNDQENNHVKVFIFTYFDIPANWAMNCNNEVIIDGNICKLSKLNKKYNNKFSLNFILANNMYKGDERISSYIPCVAWNGLAYAIYKLGVGAHLLLKGEFRSRNFIKSNGNKQETVTCYELVIKEFEEIKDDSTL